MIELFDSNRNLFERGGIDSFLLILDRFYSLIKMFKNINNLTSICTKIKRPLGKDEEFMGHDYKE